MDPWFSIARLSLLDRGFVFAVAHVRGGGELGRRWYDEGKLTAQAQHVHRLRRVRRCTWSSSGWTTADRIVARGGSAGGLLMGAVANLAPDVVRRHRRRRCPFVDVLNTILDPSLPLTVTEWEEWGNPLESAEAYAYIQSYAPYENVAPLTYPAILTMGSLNDTRVLYHEPAKWIARLRATAPGLDVLLKTEMGAGHGGPSGRYDAWREEAYVIAWILDRLAPLTAPDPPGRAAVMIRRRRVGRPSCDGGERSQTCATVAQLTSILGLGERGRGAAARRAARADGARLPPLTTATTGAPAGTPSVGQWCRNAAVDDRTAGLHDQPGGPGELDDGRGDLGLADRHDAVQPLPQVGEGQLGQRRCAARRRWSGTSGRSTTGSAGPTAGSPPRHRRVRARRR